MNNRLICLEGTLHFEEEIKTQTINMITFKNGQQITLNRDILPAGSTFFGNISQQIGNAERILNNFNLVKMDEVKDGTFFTDTIQLIYSFSAGPGSDKRVWQATYSCLISENEIINFGSMYPDETSMKNEMHRLHHCARNFEPNTTKLP